jgi:putative ABC transport system permease protein
MGAPAWIVSAARSTHRGLLRLSPAARAGYAPQMQATFDAIVARASRRGRLAVLAVLARESAGLILSRGERAAGPPPAQRSPFMRNLSQDVRFAFRTFKRRPAFTIAVVATIALGIGANAAIFSVANAILLQRLPFDSPDRLVMVWEDAASIGFPRNDAAPGNYFDWTTSVPAIAGAAAMSQASFNLTGSGEPEMVGGARVTSNLFSVLGVRPLLGRVWLAGEDVPNARVAVLSYRLWTRRFGSDAGIIDRTVSLSGVPYTVIGVMPDRFEISDPDEQIWTPLGLSAADQTNRGSHFLDVVARLQPGVTVSQLNAQLRALAERLQREHPDTNRDLGMYALPLLDDYIGDTRTAVITLLVAVGCVLLIACVNVANLLLTHSAGRVREMAVRTALGADRRRLVRQLLTESLLLAVAGGVLGIALAVPSFALLALLVPRALTSLSHVTLDLRVVLVTGAVSIFTGLLFGLAPAWRASRVDAAMAGTRSARGVVGGGSRLRSVLVVAEVALATVVLIAAGLLVESLRAARSVPLGIRPASVLTLRMYLPRRAYADPAKRTWFVDSVLDRVRALPGVTAAGVTSAVPLVWKGGTGGFRPEGMPVDRSLPYDANNRTVSPGYMETMGMTLRAGRFFDARDDAKAAPVAIISETMARVYWPGVDPLGRRFRFDSPQQISRTIVGVVGDTRVMGIEQPTRSEMYFPIAQSSDNWMWPRDLTIRAAGDPQALIRAASAAVWAVDRDQPISNAETMDEIVARELQDRRLQTTLMMVFAGLALVLAAVGIYGVLSYMVTERTAEIGVRLALGGRPSRIRARFVWRGLALAGTGVAIGLVAAFWATALIDRLLFHVRARDLGTFAVQAAGIAIVCLLAAYLPARRASRVDPVRAIRNET